MDLQKLYLLATRTGLALWLDWAGVIAFKNRRAVFKLILRNLRISITGFGRVCV